MSNPRAIRMVNHFTKKEMEAVKKAFKEFFKDFDCRNCPIDLCDNNFILTLVSKHIKYKLTDCELCQGFPTLTYDVAVGCPCRTLGKRTAKMRLKKLIEAWDEIR